MYVFDFAPGLAVAIVISTELLEEHAGWEVDKNDRCSRLVKIADLKFKAVFFCYLIIPITRDRKKFYFSPSVLQKLVEGMDEEKQYLHSASLDGRHTIGFTFDLYHKQCQQAKVCKLS
jgi:hypothetical protein